MYVRARGVVQAGKGFERLIGSVGKACGAWLAQH
jgi:hypothetical protein